LPLVAGSSLSVAVTVVTLVLAVAVSATLALEKEIKKEMQYLRFYNLQNYKLLTLYNRNTIDSYTSTFDPIYRDTDLHC
jgi:hypothetical protein